MTTIDILISDADDTLGPPAKKSFMERFREQKKLEENFASYVKHVRTTNSDSSPLVASLPSPSSVVPLQSFGSMIVPASIKARRFAVPTPLHISMNTLNPITPGSRSCSPGMLSGHKSYKRAFDEDQTESRTVSDHEDVVPQKHVQVQRRRASLPTLFNRRSSVSDSPLISMLKKRLSALTDSDGDKQRRVLDEWKIKHDGTDSAFYPSKDQRTHLSKASGLSLAQIDKHFDNWRQRHLHKRGSISSISRSQISGGRGSRKRRHDGSHASEAETSEDSDVICESD